MRARSPAEQENVAVHLGAFRNELVEGSSHQHASTRTTRANERITEEMRLELAEREGFEPSKGF